jgi:hypothetical protein
MSRLIVSLFLLISVVPPAFAAEPYTIVSPTGVAGTDTINLITAVASCTSPKGVFLGEGTFKIVLTINMPDACTITGSITGSPTASSAGIQNTVVDCSGLAGTVPCITMGISDLITGFTIIGNGSTPNVNTNCADNEKQTGGNVLTHMIFRNCGAGINYGASGCCAQNMRVVDAMFINDGYGMYAHDNATDAYFSDLTIIAPTVAGIYAGGYSDAYNRISMVGVPHGAVGFMSVSGGSPVTDMSVDGGTCMIVGSQYMFGGVRCTGDGGTNEYCLQFTGTANLTQLVGINCTGGYGGAGSSIIAETGSGGCTSTCTIDVIWNGTDPLFNSTQAKLDMDQVRYSRPIGYIPVTLTSSAFAAPDFTQGFNQSFALTSACSSGCTIPAPVVTINGQSGYYAITQDGTGSRTITWPIFYQNTAQPNTGAGKTTWFPWIARSDGSAIVLDTPFHN